MSRIRIRALLAAALLASAAPAAADEAAPPTGVARALPDIILITGDTLRADHMSVYDYDKKTTPNLEKIAGISVRFTNAMTPFPRTSPAMASLMTGLWPQHHGSREVSRPFTKGQTLAEILKSRGYATVGVSANWMAGKKQNFHKGFDGFVSMKHQKVDDRAGLVTRRALKLSSLAKPGKPLFLWAHYMDPHFPYHPPHLEEKKVGTRCRNVMRAISSKKVKLAPVQGNSGKLGEKSVADCKVLYDAEITYMDGQIGELLKGLQEQKRLSNVIIVFTADHGEAFGEQGLYYEHGTTLHDAIMKVPLMITGPGVKARVDDGVIRLEDLLPTILTMAGLGDAVPETDGVDQSWRLGLSKRPQGAREPIALAESGSALLVGAFVETFEGVSPKKNCVHGPRYSLCTLPKRGTRLYDRQEDPGLSKDVSAERPDDLAILQAARERWKLGQARQRAARDRRYKLVERPRLEGGYRRALYDLEADPSESVDVLEKHPEVAARLGAELDAWAATLPNQAPAPEMDDEQMEMLRALGYVE